MKRVFFIGTVLTVLLFTALSCASFQRDVSISADSARDDGLASAAAVTVAKADAAALDGSPNAFASDLAKLISDIENQLNSSGRLDKALEGRLLALEGRAYLLRGNQANARKCYERAVTKAADDIQVIILANRLGQDVDLAVLAAGRDDNALLILEQAVSAYKDARYSDAAGLFDTAFLYLDDDYDAAYKVIRNKAWSLKDAAVSGEIGKILTKKQITVKEMMELTQDSTDLLNAYTASRRMSGTELFQTVVRAGLMNSVSNEDSPTAASLARKLPNGISENTVLTRIITARFLWNLYWRDRNAQPQKYSARYRARSNAKSPVKDVDVTDEDFDAVLASIENEWMELPDGVNFKGNGTVSGSEFSSSVKKIK